MTDKVFTIPKMTLHGQQLSSYPLTPAQQRMWILHQLNSESTAYNSPVVRSITGTVHIRRLQHACLALVARHEQLRAAVSLHGQKPVQHIRELRQCSFSYVDDLSPEKVQPAITAFIRPFDLDHPPLLRVCLFRLEENEYILAADMHHIISDLHSEHLLIRDLFALYHQQELPSLPVQFREYAAWLNEHGSKAQLKEAEDYWLSCLDGALPVLELPLDFTRPPVFDFRGTIIHHTFPASLSAAIRETAARQSASVYSVCLTALFILLHKYSYQDDIIIGLPKEIRPDDMADVIGLFINTLPLRALPAASKSFRRLLDEVTAQVATAQQHFRYDVGYLVEQLCPERDLSRNPLYDVLFFHNEVHTVMYGELKVAPVNFIHNKAELDLTVGILETDEGISLSIEYYTGIFLPATIERLRSHYLRILEAVTGGQDLLLGDISLLDEEEAVQVLQRFNDTERPHPQQMIHRLFEQQVAARPAHPALVFNGQTLTYRELNEKADHLAHIIYSYGIETGSVVALLAAPSFDMITGILAILKAGCAYLPLDPSFPEERISYMLRSSNTKLLLAQQSLAEEWTLPVSNTIYLNNPVAAEPVEKPVLADNPAAIAYVMYTSGSTGEPKGIRVQHANVTHSAVYSSCITITPRDRILQLSNYAFDASVFDIFSALLHGATLVLATKEQRQDVYALAALFEQEKISIALITTALFNTLIDNVPASMKGLRKILTGGERVSVAHMAKALRLLGKNKLLHIYGPTETTVYATFFPVNHLSADAQTVPVGFPLPNTRLYVLNGNTPVPVGVPGELCIAGDGLAAGYVSNTGMQDPFTTIPVNGGTPVYRTGDIVKWTADGTIVFISRADTQVKIRGFRIETGEIAARLIEHPAIQDAVVIILEDQRKEKYIQACYIALPDMPVSPDVLKVFLRQVLPAFMIPLAWLQLDQLPLTTNGKLDQKKLATLAAVVPVSENVWQPPVTESEKKVALIWQELLKQDDISIHRNFFECGGHSLTATILCARIRQQWHTDLPVSAIFQHPTISSLAACIEGSTGAAGVVKIRRAKKRKHYPLSFSERMVFMHQQTAVANRSYHSLFPCR